MSEVIAETLKHYSNEQKRVLLRNMYNEVDECFDNVDTQTIIQIKNFIDSFAREI